jgi:hypothetical protein
MRIHNLYADADGQSHFRDVAIEWRSDEPTGGRVSTPLPGGLIIHEHRTDYRLPQHPAPRRQYVFGHSEDFEVTASDGVGRHSPAGDLVLVEDVVGRGHSTASVGGDDVRYTLIFPLRPAPRSWLGRLLGRLCK